MPRRRRTSRLGRFRLALLTGASLIAPGVQLVREIRRGDIDVVVIVGASAALFLLVVARIAGLVRQQERSVARERVLNTAGAALVAATRREEIYQAALVATGSLTDASSSTVLCLVDGDIMSVVAADGAPEGTQWDVNAYTAFALLGAARDGERRASVRLDPDTCADLLLDDEQCHALVLPLSLRGETRGVIVVAGEGEPTKDVRQALPGLAAQIALALESAGLTEEVHRRESEARFASLVQHSSDLITVLDPDAVVVYQSPSIERVLGYTPAEVVGTRFDRLLPEGEKARLLQLMTDGRHPGRRQPAGRRVLAAPPRRLHAPVRDPPHEPARTTRTCAGSC